MQSSIPVPGSTVWIREMKWRVGASRREHDVVRFDVINRGGPRTFLAPFDRVEPAAARARIRRVRPQQARARLADLVRQAADSRRLPTAVGAEVELLPHQLEPVLAILGGARRVLIADDVGLGKTIQAGFVLAELRWRRPALRALVIVPSPLRAQWAQELEQRFRIHSVRADAAELQHLAYAGGRGDDPWQRRGVWLASLDYLKQPHVFDALPLQPWDLVIIDEAHGVCGESGRHGVAAALARRARHLLLLTATPHSGDEARFDRLLNLGALPCSGDELTTFRRTRRDIHRPNVRRVRWLVIPPTGEEARLLNLLTDYERAVLHASGEAQRASALLLLSVFRKRALSTAGALCVSLTRRLAWLERPDSLKGSLWVQPGLHLNDDDSREADEDEEARVCAAIGMGASREKTWLSRLRQLAIAAARNESKLNRLAALADRSREPLVIFTEFRDSLVLVAERLAESQRVSVLHGGLTGDEQEREIDGFIGGRTTVLVATDVASQGLNLQSRARWVINLELPWNPARLEQRAGRVDRIGQARPVHVTMLVAGHRAESGLLSSLARKTLAAQRAFGADTLQSLAPDERQLQACLLAGDPLPTTTGHGHPATATDHRQALPITELSFSRSWARPARRIALAIGRARGLARCWQGPATSGEIAFLAPLHKVTP